MSTKVFRNNLRERGATDLIQGPGSFDVDVDFQPNFIEVQYSSGPHSETDTLEWTLAIPVPGTWRLTVNYSCKAHRKISHVIAKLPVNPEQTISF